MPRRERAYPTRPSDADARATFSRASGDDSDPPRADTFLPWTRDRRSGLRRCADTVGTLERAENFDFVPRVQNIPPRRQVHGGPGRKHLSTSKYSVHSALDV